VDPATSQSTSHWHEAPEHLNLQGEVPWILLKSSNKKSQEAEDPSLVADIWGIKWGRDRIKRMQCYEVK